MDSMLEVEEAKYISLYCSDYVREMIDSAAHFREKKKQVKGKTGLESYDYHNSNIGGLRRDSNSMTNTLFHRNSGHEINTRNSNWQMGANSDAFQAAQALRMESELPTIFQHPPTTRNFPIVQKEHQFSRKDCQTDFESEIKEKFPLGKHRQKLLKWHGMSHFQQAYPKMVTLQKQTPLRKSSSISSASETITVSTTQSYATKTTSSSLVSLNQPIFVTKRLMKQTNSQASSSKLDEQKLR